jgi:hypothetical protein
MNLYSILSKAHDRSSQLHIPQGNSSEIVTDLIPVASGSVIGLVADLIAV